MEKRLVVRPHPWRQLPITMMMLVVHVVIVWVWIINVEPDKNLGFSAVLVLMWGIYLLEAIWIKLVVTSEQVRIISSHRNPPVSREQIHNIRALQFNTVFYDHDKKPILKTHADLSRSQLLALGNELRVDVWDHRAWHGLKKLRHGVRLNPEPFPRRPPA
jgi:hypothetical protein